MSSTNRGYDRHKSDYYVTPVEQIKLFIEKFMDKEDIDDDIMILDPCAGGDEVNKMSYPSAMEVFFNYKKLETMDIRGDSLANIKANYLKYDCINKYDMIITNPPFNIALDIIKKALIDVRHKGYVIMLLRLNFLGSKQRFKFWQNNMPKYIFCSSSKNVVYRR